MWPNSFPSSPPPRSAFTGGLDVFRIEEWHWLDPKKSQEVGNSGLDLHVCWQFGVFLVIIMLYVDSGPYLGIHSGIGGVASPQFHILWISHRQECMRTSQWMLCGCIYRLYRPLLVTWRTHRNKQVFGDEHWTAIYGNHEPLRLASFGAP